MEREHVNSSLIQQGPVVTASQRKMLEEQFTEKEVKETVWAINGDKSPGPDGYGNKIFKDSWEIVGKDVIEAVMEFFRKGEILKCEIKQG